MRSPSRIPAFLMMCCNLRIWEVFSPSSVSPFWWNEMIPSRGIWSDSAGILGWENGGDKGRVFRGSSRLCKPCQLVHSLVVMIFRLVSPWRSLKIPHEYVISSDRKPGRVSPLDWLQVWSYLKHTGKHHIIGDVIMGRDIRSRISNGIEKTVRGKFLGKATSGMRIRSSD